MALNLSAKILTPDEIGFLKEKVELILSQKGVMIENHPKGLELLKKAGAEVSSSDIWVKFPKPLIEEALKKVPKTFTLAGHDPAWDLPFPHPKKSFYTRTCTGGMYYLTEKFDYHHITLDEVAEWTRLTDALPNIDFWSLPSTKPIGFPAETIDIHTLDTVLRNTTKHGCSRRR